MAPESVAFFKALGILVMYGALFFAVIGLLLSVGLL
jgi:hypothetical protein